MSIVVDASVAAKWFLKEADAPRALALLGAGKPLLAPAVLRVELSSAIIRAHRAGRMARADTEAALASASAMLQSAAVELRDTETLHTRAETIALDIKHAFADCLYVALADREQCELITTNATLLSRAAPHFPFVKPL